MNEARQKIIRESYLARGDASKAQFVKDMVKVGFKRRTVYRTLKKIESGQEMTRKPETRSRINGFTTEREKELYEAADHTVGTSFRPLERILDLDHKTVKKILNRNGIQMFKRKKVPKSKPEQRKRQKTRIRELSRSLFKAENDDVDVIMDGECYFDENGMNFHGSNTFLFSQAKLEPENVKYQTKTKYPFKLMVWIAFSKKGRSVWFIKKTMGAVDSGLYIGECLKKRLLPFIKKNYPHRNYVFWPDLASCHYSKETQSFMHAYKVNFVPKDSNTPNVPNLRPIEKFWCHLKQGVYANGWKPNNWNEMYDRVRKVLMKIDQSVCERFMSHVAKDVRYADRKGVLFNV